MAQSEADWKQKYLSNLDRLEKMEQRWNSVEELLRMGITRVALAAQGVDPQLDKHLNSLRKTIRSGKDYPDLENIVERISDTVKRLDEERDETSQSARLTVLQHVGQLLESLKFPDSNQKQVKTLLGTLKQPGSELKVDEFLRDIANLIQNALGVAPQGGGNNAPENADNDANSREQNNNYEVKNGEKRGILDRLFGAQERNQSGSISDTTQAVATLLIEFVDTLPAGVSDPAKSRLIQQLRDAQRIEEIKASLQALSAALSYQSQADPPPGSQSVVQDNGDAAFEQRILLRLIGELEDDGFDKDQCQRMRQQLQLDHTEETQIKLVEQFANLVKPGGAGRQPATPARLTAPDNTFLTPHNAAEIRHFCLKLLESLNFSEDDAVCLNRIREQLLSGIDLNEFPRILLEIADLVSLSRRRVEKEKRELQEFLRQLTERLKDIDQHLEGAESKRVEVKFSSQRFGDAVEAQVNHLQSSVQQAADLGQLKGLIQERVDAIRAHLLSHREEQEARQHQLESELRVSNDRLKTMENETQQLRERLRKEHTQAIRDALTGVNNRLAFEERMEQEYARWRRYHQPLALLIFDIDHFKSINDTYGHKAGDKALKLIANSLQRNLRESDFLARYGGEEFVVLMPETAAAAALGAANKLREAVQQNHFHYQEKEVKITVSCGVAIFKDNDTPETTFQRADQSLYYCKQNGRNRCYTQDL